MSLFQAILFGIVQGITEFLPISSSAHLVLLPLFLGCQDPGLAFDVALHWGTLLGVVVYYRHECWELIRAPRNPLLWKIALATFPGALMGLLLEDHAETAFRSPWITATTLSLMGLVLLWADRQSRNANETQPEITWLQALLIGASQGIALIPGVSRSGITISTALFLGLHRSAAVRFSFLLSIPITLGAGLVKSRYLIENITDPVVIVGIASSAIAGFLAIHFLVRYVRTRSFLPFALYRFALSALIVWRLLA